MSGESLPSGVLKVAEECARLAEEFAEVYILARNVNAPICIAARSGLHAAIDRLAALASPPPQATGAPAEFIANWAPPKGHPARPKFDLEFAALSSAKREAEPLTDAKVIAMNPYLNDEGRRALWLAAFRMAEKHHGITAASQVEPEEKHG
jgi:hypothetical protein